jgi:hypothetical protein
MNSDTSSDSGKRFLEDSQKLENGGWVAFFAGPSEFFPDGK